MKKIFNAFVLAISLFVLLNFLYSNMTPEALGYSMTFRFKVPGLFTLKSVAMPLGFVLILTFSAGILLLAFIQALPVLFRRHDVKQMRKLEKELQRIKTGTSGSKDSA